MSEHFKNIKDLAALILEITAKPELRIGRYTGLIPSAGTVAYPDFRKFPNLYPNPFTGYTDQMPQLPAGYFAYNSRSMSHKYSMSRFFIKKSVLIFGLV